MTSSISVDINTNGFCYTNGVADLYQHLIGHTSSYHIFGNMPCGISSRTIHFTRVFTRKCATTVCPFTPISIYDDFTTGKTGITVRASDNELSGRIDKVFDVIIKQRQNFFTMYLLFYTRHQNLYNIFFYLCQHTLVVIVKIVVLCADYNSIDALRNTTIRIFYSNLTFRVGPKISHLLTFFANIGQCFYQKMRQIERNGHIIFCFVGGIPKHHTLISCPLLVLFTPIHTAIDVVALLVNSRENAT